MTTTRVRLYYRISEDKTGQQLGVDRQAPDCLELCGRKAFDPIEVYVDNDLSATSVRVKRPAFERLLLDLAADPTPVVVWHTDRLIRRTNDLERVIATGVEVYAVHAGHLDLATPAGRATARTLTAWAQYEGEQKALRQVASNQQKAERGLPTWSRRPFGYDLDGAEHKVEGPLLRTAYTDVLAGASLRSIARDWNARGITTTLGGEWDGTALRWILKAPRNAGIATYKDSEVGTGDWDAIITEECLRAVQRLLADPSRRTSTNARGRTPLHLLGGIAECAHCGAPMKTNRRKWNGWSYMVLICREGCASIPMEYADEVVRTVVVETLSRPGAAQLWAVDSDSVEAVRAEVAGLRTELAEWAEDRLAGVVTREQMVAATAKITPKLTEAEDRLARLDVGTPLAGLAGTDDVAAWFDDLDVERRRAAVRFVLTRVAIKSRGKGRRTPGPEHVVVEHRTLDDEPLSA